MSYFEFHVLKQLRNRQARLPRPHGEVYNMPDVEFGIFLKAKDSARRAGPSSRRANPNAPPAYTSLGTLKIPPGSATELLIARVSKIFGEDLEPTNIVSNLNADVTFLQPSSFLFLCDGYSARARAQHIDQYIDARAALSEQRPIRLMLQRVAPNAAPPHLPQPAPPPRLPCVGEPLVQGPVPKQPQPPPPPPAAIAPPPAYCLLENLACCFATMHGAPQGKTHGLDAQGGRRADDANGHLASIVA